MLEALPVPIIWLLAVELWLATVVTCLRANETLRGQCQKLDGNIYGRKINLVMEEIIGNIGLFVKYWATDEVVSREGVEFGNVVQVLLTSEKCLCLKRKMV